MMTTETPSNHEQIEKIMHWFRGNGQPGVFEQLRRNEEEIERVKDDIVATKRLAQQSVEVAQQVAQQQKEISDMMKGARIAVRVFVVILTLIGLSGGSWIMMQLNEVLSLLQ